MKKFLSMIFASAAVMMAVSCEEQPQIPDTSVKFPAVERTSYTNPISTQSLPDPTVIRGEDGLFYLYATEDIRNMPIMVSENLIDWVQSGIVFRDNIRPDDVAGAMFWAPDITKQGDKYILYYSIAPSDFATNQWTWGVGATVADNPAGPWKDAGKVFLGGEVGVRCSIDPFYVESNGNKYMVWGSFFGIWAVKLSEDGLSVKPNAEKVRLMGLDGYSAEAAMVYQKDGYYYLFTSIGGAGYSDNYQLGVVRSKNFLGPYVNKNGENATEGAGVHVIMKSNDKFQSPGHCSGIITDDNGTDWILYHSYVKEEADAGRRLMLDKITWGADGWPVINGGNGPTEFAEEVPVFMN